MARAIDADNLIRIAREKKASELFPNWKELSSETRNAIGVFGQYWKSLIEDAPTIEAEHGEWNLVKRKNIWDDLRDVYECSKCKKYTINGRGITSLTDFCPNCGADMRGAKK